ncbi:MAG: chromate transporter [Clostridia bacterium]|nr:chromate transporter [Clostridia bacterium]
MIFLELLLGFLKIGCFSFGGGYGAVPLIREVVLSYGWLDEEKLSYMIAVSESSPGPIMVNMATYIGASQAGIPGALLATAAVVLPAFLIVIILTTVLKKLLKNETAQTVLSGLKSCVAGIILATGVYIILTNCFGRIGGFSVDAKAIILTAVLAAVYFGAGKIVKKGVSPVLLICLAGIAGVLIYGWN